MTSPIVLKYAADIVSSITILSCLFLKVPQINSIRRTCSAKGVFIQAVILEVTGYTIVTLYNYTNSYSPITYLEYPIILVQLYVLGFYVLKYRHMLDNVMTHLGVMFYITLVVSFALGYLSKDILVRAIPLATPISGFSKVTYIYGIMRAQNADAVSLTTWMISILTNLGRIFTVFIDSQDPNLITNFAVSTVLSSGVFLTALFYKRNPANSEPSSPELTPTHEHYE